MSKRKYDWVTVRQSQSIVDNQHPNFPATVFDNWVGDGWEIVSVTPMPPHSSMCSCEAIGVLRRAHNGRDSQ